MDKEPKQESGDFEKAKEAYSQFLMAYKKFRELSKSWDGTGEPPTDIKEAANEADEYVDILPKLLSKKFDTMNDQRFLQFDPCPGGKRCQSFSIIKQEYWGDDMGQSVIDGYKD